MADATTSGIAHVLWHGSASHIAVLRWPTQEKERQRLDRLGLPRLLLIEANGTPPECLSCIEDWTHLPAPNEDLFARIAALRARANRHPTTPTTNEHGRFSYREHRVYLSPGEHALAQPLAKAFCEPVPERMLLENVFPDGTGTAEKLRLHVHRLRKRITHMGLQITPIRSYGYMMSNNASTADPGQLTGSPRHDVT